MGAGAGTRTEEVYQAVLKDLLARAHRTRSRGIAQVSTAAQPWPRSVPLSAARNALPTRRPGQPANNKWAALGVSTSRGAVLEDQATT
jgi:hypothetical protein